VVGLPAAQAGQVPQARISVTMTLSPSVTPLTPGPTALTRSRATGVAVGFLAVALHTVALHGLLFVPGGLDLGFFEVASLVGWQVALVVLIATWRFPVAGLSVILLPLTAGTTLLPIWFESSSVIAEPGWRLESHILLSLLAYSLLTVAAVQVLVVVAQERRLRAHRTGGWTGLLQTLDKDVTPRELPVLPATHQGRAEALVMVRRGADAGEMVVLRLWATPLRLQPGRERVWIGTVHTLRFTRRLDFFSYWQAQPGEDALLDGLHRDIPGLDSALDARTDDGQRVLRLRPASR